MHPFTKKSALLILVSLLFAPFIFADTWDQTTTADFNTAGSVASGTQVINDSVRLAQAPSWWQTPANWWDSAWQYARAITVNNNSGGILYDHQVLVEPFRDSGTFTGDDLNNTGLVGSWSFSEGTGGAGTTTVDASGLGNTGTLGAGSGNPSWTVGRFGNGLKMDGTDDYVLIGNPVPATLQLQNAITLEAWIFATQYPASSSLGLIVGCQRDSNTSGYAIHLDGRTNPDGQTSPAGHIHFQIGDGGWHVTNANAQVPLNQWVHIVATRKANENARIYYNGVLQPSTSVAWTGAVTYTNADYSIGRQVEYGTRYFNGQVDEVKVYNRALSSEEVEMRYGSGLIASWHFSEGSGTAVADSSGQRNNGTLSGSPTWISGRFGSGMSFSGSWDVMAITSIPCGSEYTIETWFQYPLPASGGGNTLTRGVSNDHQVYIEPSSKELGVFDNQFGSGWRTSGFNTSTLSNGWHHLVASAAGTTTMFYIDGMVVGTSPFKSSAQMSYIGNYQGGGQQFGTIDEVRIYNRALFSSEVKSRYNLGIPKYRHDFGDIRFTNFDSSQTLDYWQETDTRFWVEVPSLSTGANTIRMYYGNASATTASSGPNTFVLFDDFNNGVLDGTLWTGTGTETNGSYRITASTYLRSVTVAPGDNLSYSYKVARSAIDNGFYGMWKGTGASQFQGGYGMALDESPANVFKLRRLAVDVASTSSITWTAGNFYQIDVKSAGTPGGVGNVKIWKSGGMVIDWNDTAYLSDNYINFYTNASTAYIDEAYVRKYSAIEPTPSAPEAETPYYLSNANGGSWKYNRSIAVNNNSGGSLADYQLLLQPFRDTGDFIGDNLDNTGLVGSWFFSEGTGATTVDASGNNYTGAISGAAWRSSGRFGNSLSFAAVTDRVQTSASVLSGTGDFTVAAWIYSTTAGDTDFIQGNYGLTNSGGIEFYISANKLCVYVSGSVVGSSTLSVNTWYHVAATRSSGAIKLYVNGVQDGSGTLNSSITTSLNWAIGNGPDYTSELFEGMIDEPIVFNRALSAEEISLRYGSGLVGSWHFSEGSGITAADSSGKANNGTLTNGPVWAAGKFGNAITFDGTNDYVSVPDKPEFAFGTGSFTIELWAKWNNLSNIESIIGQSAGGGNNLKWGLFKSMNTGFAYDNTLMTFNFMNPAGTNYFASWSWTAMTATWYHIAMVRNGSSWYLYVNGVETGGIQPQAVAMPDVPTDLRIGSDGEAWQYFNGTIDEPRIYNRALSAAEVSLRYSLGLPKVRHDLGDVRFTNSDSSQELGYWQETDQWFWVKAPTLASGADTVIMYYGNDLATASSDGFKELKSNMVAYWKLDEGSGTYGYDARGVYHGTQTGATQGATGKVGSAYGFGGDGDKVDFGLKSAFDFGSRNFTLSLWVYPTEAVGSWEYFFDYAQNDSNGPWILGRTTTGYLRILMAHPTAWDTIADTTLPLPTNSWSHIVIVRDGTNVYPYVNTSPGATVLNVDALSTQATRTLKLGTYGNGEHFQGTIDEVGMWSRTLTGAEVTALYNSGNGKAMFAAIEPTHSAPGAETLPYSTSGTYTSAVKNAGGDDGVIDEISWTVSGTGTITMQVRADNSDPLGWDDSSPAWEAVDNGDTTVAVMGRYLQYKATFSGGSGTSSDPVLLDVALTYTIPIFPPGNSVSCARLANTWYSTAGFVFSNDTGFGADIMKYYYVWDNSATHSFDLSEDEWSSSDLLLNATSSDPWYMHYLPESSTLTTGTVQDLGPFKFDGTAPSAASLTTPVADENVADSAASFAWGSVSDTSGVEYSLQIDRFTSFSAPVIEVDGIMSNSYTLSGSGTEFLVGNTIYYWRVVATDGAGNSTASFFRKFTTTSALPQIVNSTTGVVYPDLQSALDSPSTSSGDVIDVGDSLAHDESLIISKDLTIQNGLLSPSSGFAATGQGPSGGEVLRNCVITAGGISDLALGQNLTIYGTDPDNPVVVSNSKLVNCVIKLGTSINGCTLENCFLDATSAFFEDVFTDDFQLTASATDLIDKGVDLSSDFTVDKDGMARGINILDVANYDSGAWDIGAYEFKLDSGYISPGGVTAEAPNKPSGVYPAGGADGFLTDVVVSWTYSGAAVAASFTVEWGTDPAFLVDVTTASGITSYIYLLEGLIEDAVIYWRVKGVNEYGESPWSDALSFTTNYGELFKQAPDVPAPTYPADGATGISSDTVFMWDYIGVAPPGTYTVEWSVISTMTGSVHTISGIATEACQVEDLPLETAIYWRVKALNSYGESSWSPTMSFTTTGDTLIFAEPGELSFSMAANEAIAEKKSITVFSGLVEDDSWTVTVNGGWMTASPTTGTFADAKVFTVEVSVSPLGLTAGETYVGAITVALDSGLNEIAIPVYLEVTAADDGGDGGDDGGGETTDLQAPTLVSPADGQGGFDAEPYLIWTAESNATSYIVQVGRDAAFTMISVNYEVSSTQYLPPALEKGTNYYWRVKSVNSGKMSAWSSTRWFALNPAEDDAKKSCFLGSLMD